MTSPTMTALGLPDAMTGGLPVRGSRATVLDTLTPVDGLHIVDIGCGDGTWTRFLTEAGAHVTGIDPNPRQLDKARATPLVGAERYISAGAEALPLEDRCQDVALFFNSLHHVPVDIMTPALMEAARVTRPGGRIVAFEPVARGANYTLNRPIDDEFEVRARAHQSLHAAADDPDTPLTLEQEFEYITVGTKRDFEAWREYMVRISPVRAVTFEANEADLRAHFDRVLADLPRDEEGAALLDQPMRATVLRRT
ncbi:class I SAM-dependent methyltransferase [Roseospira marina]|uniref:Class I SAM-dependent methyltransferase n=1 Tax=Roseospira marina TaxID=140057 RepID=A0A5M6IGD9_9PROT|nr:class I SAM-dependent methyltransferase [Roseospira marina]KAA5607371.1 class I SAM-dependent methyltransferase [Roseospira marina]MBB4312460.1 hypothetical protein [Roseospira marina]MBB5085524.1 hypothetical protein [Roseospira marina]